MIQSLLDTDVYKLFMAQFYWKNFRNVRGAKFKLYNRMPMPLTQFVDPREVRHIFGAMQQNLRFQTSELFYLRGMNLYGGYIFEDEFIKYLRDFRLSDFDVTDDLEMTFQSDDIVRASMWETIAMSVLNELAWRNTSDVEWAKALVRLDGDAQILKRFPFIEFGSRRRRSFAWQVRVNQVLGRLGTYGGTSNILVSLINNTEPRGTQAHEVFMIASGLYDFDLDRANAEVNKLWWDMYGVGLSIYLPDTFTSDRFFKILTEEELQRAKGFRQDSGDPNEFARKLKVVYESAGIDPKGKMLIFSDALTATKADELWMLWKDTFRVSFGIGTSLTNSLGHLNIVIKAAEIEGKQLFKQSDDPAKQTGAVK